MEMNIRVPFQERIDALGLVSRQVVENDVYLSSLRLARYYIAQKSDELFAGVAASGSSDHLSASRIKSRVQR
jgi:hypothetical protein